MEASTSASLPAARSLLLDCTLRDGGYINNWMFSDEFVRACIPIVSEIVDIVDVSLMFRKLTDLALSEDTGTYPETT